MRRIASWISFFMGGFVFLPPQYFAFFQALFAKFYFFSSFLSSKQLLLFCFIPSVFWCFYIFSILFYPFYCVVSFGNFFWLISFGCFFWQFLLAVVGFCSKKGLLFRFLPPQYFADFQALFAKFGTFWAFLRWLFLCLLRLFFWLQGTVALTNTHPLLSLLCAGFGGWVCVSALVNAAFFFLFSFFFFYTSNWAI